MKKKTLLLLIFAIPVAALWWGGRQLSGDQAASGIAFLGPSDPAFDDLDTRDSQNQPLSDPTQREVLQTLFRENLVTLRVFALPHFLSQTYCVLESISWLFNKVILIHLASYFKLLQDVLFSPQR